MAAIPLYSKHLVYLKPCQKYVIMIANNKNLNWEMFNLLSPNVASKEQTVFFHTNPVLLEIHDQFLRL